MNVSDIPIIELLPHGPEFALIDALISTSDDETIAVVTVREDTPFAEGGGVPAYVAIEYMAQTIAARIGYLARLNGLEPPIGFLLGTRLFTCSASHFPLGSRIEISVRPMLTGGSFGAFACCISTGDVIAEATLNTYQPKPDMAQS
jgi:predicted hotdog family 3-hydroxylacyl-ACP dehydratase